MGTQAVFGVYQSHKEAERAISALKRAGYDPSHITLRYSENQGVTHDMPYAMRTMIGIGAIVGGSLGLFIGAAMGAVLGSGILNSTALGVMLGGLCGLLFGAGAGALVGIGTPQPVENRYQDYLREGGVLLEVDDDHRPHSVSASEILEQTGASDVSQADEERVIEALKNT